MHFNSLPFAVLFEQQLLKDKKRTQDDDDRNRKQLLVNALYYYMLDNTNKQNEQINYQAKRNVEYLLTERTLENIVSVKQGAHQREIKTKGQTQT